jgi:hypothetical protein
MPETTPVTQVPTALRNWFIIHFLTDILFAVPLMIAPTQMLTFFGWQMVDPYTARMAAAALLGIGIESYLGRNASRETYRNMLTLKIIWSLGVISGIAITIVQGAQAPPIFIWIVLALFSGFNLLWGYWRWKIR